LNALVWDWGKKKKEHWGKIVHVGVANRFVREGGRGQQAAGKNVAGEHAKREVKKRREVDGEGG